MKRLLLAVCLCGSLATPLWASEEVGRQEDSPNADTQVLMPVGCVRQDTIASSTSNDGDYQNVKCTSIGRVYTSATIDAALPTGANAIGKLTANSGVIIGDVNVVNTPTVNAAVTSQIPGTGATNLGKAEDQTFVNADTGVATLCVRADTSTTSLAATGTYANCRLNANGHLYTVDDTEISTPAVLADNTANPTLGAVAAYLMCFDTVTWDRCISAASDTDDNSVAFSQTGSIVLGENHVSDGTSWVRLRTYLEDVAASGHDGGQLFIIGGVRQDAPAGTTNVDGDYANFKTDSVGRLWVNCGSGCASGATTPTDAFANPTTAALNMTFNTGWNGATWDRLQVDGSKYLKVNCATGCAGGATTPTDAFANPTTAGLQMTFNTGWNGATWDRLQVDGSKFLKVNCSAGCTSGATTPTDAFANPTTASLNMTFNMGYNGTTWDRLQVDGSKYLKTAISAALPTGGNTIGTVNIGTIPGTAVEDSAATDLATGMLILSVRKDTANTSSNADGDNSTINTNAAGALWATLVPSTNGGTTPCVIQSAASTNSTNCKASAGQLYGFDLVNTTTTIYYLRIYNASGAPTCSSSTGFVRTVPIPPAAAAGGAGGIVRSIEVGEAYGTGLGFCLTGGGSSTDNSSAATGVYITLNYK